MLLGTGCHLWLRHLKFQGCTGHLGLVAGMCIHPLLFCTEMGVGKRGHGHMMVMEDFWFGLV